VLMRTDALAAYLVGLEDTKPPISLENLIGHWLDRHVFTYQGNNASVA